MIAKNDKDWHLLVCEEANYVCVACGRDYSDEYYFNEKGVNQYVCGHHDKTKGSHPELRLETTNGRCVCNSPPHFCHNKIHTGEIILNT